MRPFMEVVMIAGSGLHQCNDGRLSFLTPFNHQLPLLMWQKLRPACRWKGRPPAIPRARSSAPESPGQDGNGSSREPGARTRTQNLKRAGQEVTCAPAAPAGSGPEPWVCRELVLQLKRAGPKELPWSLHPCHLPAAIASDTGQPELDLSLIMGLQRVPSEPWARSGESSSPPEGIWPTEKREPMQTFSYLNQKVNKHIKLKKYVRWLHYRIKILLKNKKYAFFTWNFNWWAEAEDGWDLY